MFVNAANKVIWDDWLCKSKKKFFIFMLYHQTSNTGIRHTLGNKIADHSDLVGATPVGAAPTTSSFST